MEEYIIPEERENLFSEEEPIKEQEVTIVKPPIINNNDDDDNNLLDRTPVFKITTPIRKKPVERNEEGTFKNIPKLPEFNLIDTPVYNHRKHKVLTPKPDYSDEDVVNKRVVFLINNPNDVDYEKEDEKVTEICKEVFEVKYKNLAIHYPDQNIVFPEDKPLNKIHKKYHEYIKNIYITLNLPQTQLYYILSFFVLEFVLVKAFGLPMAGFTKAELKKMHKQNSLLIELGESFYSTSYGGEPESLEWRLVKTLLWNIILFVGVKLITNYFDAEDLSDMVRGLIEKLTDSDISRDSIENGEHNSSKEEGFDGLIEELSNGAFSGSNANGLMDLISGIGTSFTEDIEKKNRSKRPKERRRKRAIFEE